MRYIIAKRRLAASYGISSIGHTLLNQGKNVIINEKELSIVKGENIEDKIKAIEGILCTSSELKKKLKEDGV